MNIYNFKNSFWNKIIFIDELRLSMLRFMKGITKGIINFNFNKEIRILL